MSGQTDRQINGHPGTLIAIIRVPTRGTVMILLCFGVLKCTRLLPCAVNNNELWDVLIQEVQSLY